MKVSWVGSPGGALGMLREGSNLLLDQGEGADIEFFIRNDLSVLLSDFAVVILTILIISRYLNSF